MNLISLISNHAKENPDKIAIKFLDELIPYKDLLKNAMDLAYSLKMQGVRDEVIGLCMEYSPKLITSILAALILQCPFVPLDKNYPPERINNILKNSKIKYVLASSQHDLNTLNSQIVILNIDEIHVNNINTGQFFHEVKNDENKAAYILYTSGTTGEPKGVVVNQSSLLNTYVAWEKAYQLTPSDIHLQIANSAFDVFYGDLIRALCSGAKLVLCPRNYLLRPKLLYKIISDEQITCAEFVPAILRRLVSYLEKNGLCLEFIRLLICGSDNWSIGEYKKFKSFCRESTRLINSYGLTEATIDSCFFELSTDNERYLKSNDSVPIGKPFDNTQIYLLTKKMLPVKSNEIGELYISGPGLAQGYLNHEELTKQRFIESLIEGKEVRLLKTGDLARYLPDGNIQLIGRNDSQIKIYGRRIELSGIENHINLHQSIDSSLVTVVNKNSDHKYLVAYLVANGSEKITFKELRKFLQKSLPDYMIPKHYIYIGEIPLTLNGKINRQIEDLLLPICNSSEIKSDF